MLQCLTALDAGGTLVGNFTMQDAPNPGIKIAQELLQLPLGAAEIEKIAQSGTNLEDAPVSKVDAAKVRAVEF